MNPVLRNILAVAAGLVAGSVLNMALINLGPMLIPPPDGADMTTSEGLKAAMAMMEPKHFIFPFLAHASGTMAGAWIAVKLAASHFKVIAMIIGAFFFMGGALMVQMLPSPMWFNATDLILAYFPMAWLGHKWACDQ